MMGTASVAASVGLSGLREFEEMPYCHAIRSFATLPALICERGEWRWPLWSYPYAGQSPWPCDSGTANVASSKIRRTFIPPPVQGSTNIQNYRDKTERELRKFDQ